AHHQPRARARIAEIENRLGLSEAADARAAHAPASLRMMLDRRAELPASLRGAQHVVAFEEALDPRFADGQKPENERPVRGRFVAGNAHAAGERAGAFRRERPCLDRSGAGHAHSSLLRRVLRDCGLSRAAAARLVARACRGVKPWKTGAAPPLARGAARVQGGWAIGID